MTEPRISRRTVAKGAAWAVPVVAVVAPAAALAASGQVPPPVINFGIACGNVGAVQKGCGGAKTIQVPLTLTNLTATPVVFQITSMYTCNCGTAPTGPGAGVVGGVRGIWKTPNHSVPSQNDCTAVASSNCPGVTTDGFAIIVPAGTNGGTYWIESKALGSASNFSTRINWRLLNADCSIISTGTAATAKAISPQNCDG